jgi:predicted glycosyltransferase
MIEHIARHPRIRDKSIFVGNPDDIVPGTFGPGLPEIRAWTEQHFDFCGYITGLDPAKATERAELRSRFGYGEDEKICIVTVGGSGVGAPLLRRIAEAFPAIRRQLPGLRMIMVAGPRIEARSLRFDVDIEVHGYMPDLDKHLAACDVALVQGGLTTCMELTAARVPFLYFPLRNHFEQNVHVRHRLNRYGAGRAMDYEAATPDEIAAALLDQLRRPIEYRAVESDGALRAATMLAPMI